MRRNSRTSRPLRTPPANHLDALKDAAGKLDRAINAGEGKQRREGEPHPAEVDKATRAGLDPKLVKRGNEVANQQAKAEFATATPATPPSRRPRGRWIS